MLLRFDGLDWVELAEYWGVRRPWHDDQDTLAALQKHLKEARHSASAHGVAAELRAFLSALHFNSTDQCHAPVWDALRSIRDDHKFLSFAECLLPRMWC